AAVLAAASLADRWLHPSDGAALLVSVVSVALIAFAAAYLIWPFRRRPDDGRVARFVEERCPELDDSIVSAVDASPRPRGPEFFAPLLVDGAVERRRQLDLERIVDRGRLGRRTLHLAAASAGLLVALVLAAPLLFHAFEVARLRYLPGTIAVTVQPGNARV